ncbi:MAG TPA: MATE family efflux transporter [Kofleriaceae bacterium]|jgi:MATE family multidrug resistance protein
MPGKAAPLRVLVGLALPMVLARATQAVITFADAIQVKHLGEDAITATGVGGLNTFMFIILPMGAAFIIQSFVAQLAGRGDRDEAPRFAWYGLAIALVFAVIGAIAIPFCDDLLSLTKYPPALRTLMAHYMAIRLLSVLPAVGTEALGNWFGGLGNTWMQMTAGILSMVSAVFFNWLLIDGHLGAPAMGVAGAALGSVLATWLGFLFLAVAFWRRWGGAPKTRAHNLSLRELRRVARFGLPNGMNWLLEFGAFQLFVNFVLPRTGNDSVAALSVVINVNSIAFMPAFGLASAGAILAGQAIGRGDHDAVWPQVKITLAAAGAWMGLLAVVDLVFPAQVLGLFNSEHAGNLIAVGTSMLMLSAAWQLFDATSMTLSETLRAAGDTTYTAVARLIIAWAVFVPSALLVVHLGGGPLGAMACLILYMSLLATFLAFRFKSGAWRRIQLVEPKLEDL